MLSNDPSACLHTGKAGCLAASWPCHPADLRPQIIGEWHASICFVWLFHDTGRQLWSRPVQQLRGTLNPHCPCVACMSRQCLTARQSIRRAHTPCSPHTALVSCILVQGLPASLVPYLRLAHAHTAEEVATRGLADAEKSQPLSPGSETEALHHLAHYLHMRLDKCAPESLDSKNSAVALLYSAR